MTISFLIALVLMLLVAGTFTVVFTNTLIPMIHFTWDGRVLTPNQVFNRESLRRVARLLADRWDTARRSTRLEWLRNRRVFPWMVGAYALGYFGAMSIHALILLVLR